MWRRNWVRKFPWNLGDFNWLSWSSHRLMNLGEQYYRKNLSLDHFYLKLWFTKTHISIYPKLTLRLLWICWIQLRIKCATRFIIWIRRANPRRRKIVIHGRSICRHCSLYHSNSSQHNRFHLFAFNSLEITVSTQPKLKRISLVKALVFKEFRENILASQIETSSPSRGNTATILNRILEYLQ